MFKNIILLLLLFLLTSCFDEDSTSDASVQTVFESQDFSMKIPKLWEVIKNTDSILPKPANGEVVFDVVSKTKTSNIYRNILVLKQDIVENISSFDFTT
jgi:hypothetical protein